MKISKIDLMVLGISSYDGVGIVYNLLDKKTGNYGMLWITDENTPTNAGEHRIGCLIDSNVYSLTEQEALDIIKSSHIITMSTTDKRSNYYE